MNGKQQTSATVLSWPKRLLSADDLRRHLTSQRELLLLPKTIITPLAVDELRAKGVRISWQATEAVTPAQGTWCYVQEKNDALIASALQAIEREGITLRALEDPTRCAEAILAGGHLGGIVFCGDPALACCLANKISGMRAAPVFSAAHVTRAKKNWAANLFAIETAGRTFFELRQMLRTIVSTNVPCPEPIANTLKELDGHAHR